MKFNVRGFGKGGAGGGRCEQRIEIKGGLGLVEGDK